MVTDVNNIMQFMASFQQLAANPAQFVMKNYGIPKDIANNPDAIIQKLMSEGRISQAQYNSARQMAGQIQNNPMFQQYFKK